MDNQNALQMLAKISQGTSRAIGKGGKSVLNIPGIGLTPESVLSSLVSLIGSNVVNPGTKDKEGGISVPAMGIPQAVVETLVNQDISNPVPSAQSGAQNGAQNGTQNAPQSTQAQQAQPIQPNTQQAQSASLADQYNTEGIDAVKKAAVKRMADSANKAMDSGVAPEQVLKEAAGTMEGMQKQGEQSKEGDSQQGVLKNLISLIANFGKEGEKQGTHGSVLGRALRPLGRGVADVMTLGGVLKPPAKDQLAFEQIRNMQHEREVGMSAAKRQEIDSINFNNLMKTGNKALSGDAAKTVANVRSGLEQVNALKSAFAKDPNVFKQWATPGNAQGQIIKNVVSDLKDIVGRLRSGGAINAEESKAFMEQIPSFGFFKGRWEAPETVTFKLNKLNSLFGEVEGLAQPNQGLQSGIQAALDAGFKKEEIMERLKSKGAM